MSEKFEELKKHLRKFLPQNDAGKFKKISFWIISGLIGITILGIITLAGGIAILSIGLPDVTDLENITATQSTQIYDREGNLLYTIHGDENRQTVDYENISQYLIDATVAIEDDRFWEHSGFDIWGIGSAVLHELFGIGTQRGGSTITQQYIKNAFLSPERSYIRKAKELILSIRLERAYTKEEILGLYLNRIPYGNNAYGCEVAAKIYFAKSCKDIDLAESSVLASLPQGPTRYNPYGNNKFSHMLRTLTDAEINIRDIENEYDLDEAEYSRGLIGSFVDLGNGTQIYIQGRTDIVLKRMYELGYIEEDERKAALDELQKIQFSSYAENITAYHFVFYVKQVLEEKYGKDVVEQGGLKVYTTLNPELQAFAEKTVKEKAESNEKEFGANNAAALTVNAKTGEILAMVGSRDYANEEIDGKVNVVLRPRQPGSSFKPIVYAQAFYNGYGPGTIMYDIPMRLGTGRPVDYDGRWLGQMTLRRALGQSRNIPAIAAYFLAEEQDPIIDLAAKMGITSLDKSHSYGYPLALGAGEVPLIEMVEAFSVFATNGKKPELTGILKVENSNGDVLEEWEQKEPEEVLDPQIAYLINSILSDKENAIGGKLFIDGKTNAAKTGTSTKESKKGGTTTVRPSDNWTIGYTPTIVTGVWVGNTDGTGLNYNGEAYYSAAPIFTAIMTKALEDIADEPFIEPEGIKHIKISKLSGKLPGPNTPDSMVIEEVFASFSVPTETDDSLFQVKIDKISGLRATEFTPKDAVEEVLFQNYEPPADLLSWKNEIYAYFKAHPAEQVEGEDTSGNTSTGGLQIKMGFPPQEYDNIHTEQTAANAPSITITNPVSSSSLPFGEADINIDLTARNGVAKVEFYFDDQKEYFTETAPYTGHINISKFLKPGTKHLIVAKIIDVLGYSNESAVEIKIEQESGE